MVYEGKNPADLLGMFKPDGKLKFLAALLIEKNKKNPFEVIVAADTDFIYDTFWSSGRTILENNYFIPLYDNANFILNSLDYLAGDETLIDLRGRTQKIRRFEGIENMRKENLRNFRIKENDIFRQIDKTKKALQEVFGKREFEERNNFTSDELAVIAGTRQRLDTLRSELAAIRMNMHRNIEQTGMMIKFVNIYLVPLLILLLLAAAGAKGFYRRGGLSGKVRISFNREFKTAAVVTVLLAAAGGVSFLLTMSDAGDGYENRPVFEGLTEKLNDVEKVVLTSAEGELSFFKEDGVWKLEGEPCAVVYQERIGRFLAVLADAVYYEKKSDKAEYLSRFGLGAEFGGRVGKRGSAAGRRKKFGVGGLFRRSLRHRHRPRRAGGIYPLCRQVPSLDDQGRPDRFVDQCRRLDVRQPVEPAFRASERL